MSRVVGPRDGGDGKTAPKGGGTVTASGFGKGARNSAGGIDPGGHGESIPEFAEPAMEFWS